MANDPVGLLTVVVYVGWVAVSVPLALAVYGLTRWLDDPGLTLRYVGAALVGVVLAGATALALFVAPFAGAVFVGLAVAAGIVLAAFPLYIGRQLLERWTTPAPGQALEYAVLGWPVALVASLVVFLAPGGPGRYTITFLTGSVAALAWVVLGLVVTLGPGVCGFAMYRLVARLE